MKNYENANHTPNGKASKKRETETVKQTGKRIYKMDSRTKGHSRNSKRQTTVSSKKYVTDGFLKAIFLPRPREHKMIQDSTEIAKLERDYKKSLSILAKHYNIVPKPLQYDYPLNISLSLKDIQQQLKEKIKDWETVRILRDNKKTIILCEQRYDTGMGLYYIPVIPLYRLLKDKQRKKGALLLLSVFSYLYHNADIPYYRQEQSFLYWQYEILTEWIINGDFGEAEECINEINKATLIGDIMEQKISNKENLKIFRNRLSNFKYRDSFDYTIGQIARTAYSLYEKYPEKTIYTNGRPNVETTNEDYDYIITMDKYVSFSADLTGWLSDNLLDMINNEFQENDRIEEPAIDLHFDGRCLENNNLNFEHQLFALLDRLLTFLQTI